jgi:hypothetical protein
MNTSNTFLRYFREENGETKNEVHVSIASLNYNGTPIDPETGEDLIDDGQLYRLVGPNNYKQIK